MAIFNRKYATIGAIALTGALTLTACGGSSGNKSSQSSASPSSASSTASTSAATSDSTSASPSASATPPTAAALKAVVLQASDLPTGWVGTAYKADPEDAKNQAALLQCTGGTDTSADKIAEVHSEDYAKADASISSEADGFKTQASIDADVANLKNPKISACYDVLFRQQVEAALPAGGKVNSVSIVITPGANGGPDSVVATGTGKISITANGQSGIIYLNVAFLTGPLTEAEVDFENVGTPVPAAVQSAAIAAMAKRLAG